jgi:hypothetical protein
VADLQRQLELLRRELELPPAPDLAPAIAARVKRRRAATRTRRRLVLALVAALLVLGAVMAAAPGARDAVLDLFGLRGATVERREELPRRDLAERLELGERVTLEGARRAAGFRVLVPRALGPPRAVHLRRAVPGGEVTLVYGRRPLLVTQFRGDLAPEYVGKIAPESARVERIDGGLYIIGAPHLFFYRGPDGIVYERSLRLARDVLLLERGLLLVRVEGAGSPERARAIADSLAAG